MQQSLDLEHLSFKYALLFFLFLLNILLLTGHCLPRQLVFQKCISLTFKPTSNCLRFNSTSQDILTTSNAPPFFFLFFSYFFFSILFFEDSNPIHDYIICLFFPLYLNSHLLLFSTGVGCIFCIYPKMLHLFSY